MGRYRSRPVEVEAIQFTGKNGRQVKEWVNSSLFGTDPPTTHFVTMNMTSTTGKQAWRYISEGKDWGPDIVAAVWDKLHSTWVGVKIGQFIIRGMKDEHYPCDPDVFATKYEWLHD